MTYIGLGSKPTYTAKLTNTALHWRDNGGGRYYNSFFGDFGGATMCIEGGSLPSGTPTSANTSGQRASTAYNSAGAGADRGRLGHLVLRPGVGQPAGAEEQHLLVLRERQHDPERDGGPGRDLRLRRGQGLLRPGRLHERGAAEPVPRLQRAAADQRPDAHRGGHDRQAGPGLEDRPAAQERQRDRLERPRLVRRRLVLQPGDLPGRLLARQQLGVRLVHAGAARLLPDLRLRRTSRRRR